ncbi:MAG: DUF736 domain-containing protein [Pseudomonadota bacterium]
MKIGHFTKTESGNFEGRLQTLTLQADLQFVPLAEKTNDAQPDFRVVDVNTNCECGAGWHKTSQDAKPYISFEIDDPSLPSAIYPILTRDDNGEFSLYWNRQKKRSATNAKSETL